MKTTQRFDEMMRTLSRNWNKTAPAKGETRQFLYFKDGLDVKAKQTEQEAAK